MQDGAGLLVGRWTNDSRRVYGGRQSAPRLRRG